MVFHIKTTLIFCYFLSNFFPALTLLKDHLLHVSMQGILNNSHESIMTALGLKSENSL